MSLFYPTLQRKNITEVTAADLRALGVRGILLDVDNTLTRHNSQDVPSSVRRWLSDRQADGFLLSVVSNNDEARVSPFATALGLSYVAGGRKPLPGGFSRAARLLGLPKSSCVVVGDQIFTDILGANLSGMPSVLLMPLAPEEKEPFIAFKRCLERPILAAYRRRELRQQKRRTLK